MLTLRPELEQKLEKIAQIKGVTANELLNNTLSLLVDNFETDDTEFEWESEEQKQAVLEAIADSENPNVKRYSTEEVTEELARRRAIRLQQKASNG